LHCAGPFLGYDQCKSGERGPSIRKEIVMTARVFHRNPARRFCSRSCGFTLTEVLVVVAVIVVLIGLLLVALAAVRKQGDMAKSLNNLKQISVWMNQYSADNREAIVPSQFDYSDPSITYKGPVRSIAPPDPNYGGIHEGTWTDILWTTFELGRFAQAALPPPDGMSYDYRFDSPDKPLYDLPGMDFESPFRAGGDNTTNAQGGGVMTPFGSGAQEKGRPGFFAANDFFNARPDSPNPDGGQFYTRAQIKRPDQSMYLVDSFAGETIAPLPPQYQLDPLPNPPTCEVDFRYSGVCLMLMLDGHVDQQGKWKDLDQLETERRVRVRDLTRN
jgi:type II secretory pathway pseudopilin PulG